MPITIDHPRVRAHQTCPICDGPKATGLVACWPCYRATGMRYGCPSAEHAIDQQERLLTTYEASERL